MIHSAGGVIVNNGRVALVQNTYGVTFPKGRLVPFTEEQIGTYRTVWTESLLDGAYREIREETGLLRGDLSFQGYLETYQRKHRGMADGQRKYISMFLFSTTRKDLAPITIVENPNAVLVSIDDVVGKLTFDEDKAFFLRHRDRYDL